MKLFINIALGVLSLIVVTTPALAEDDKYNGKTVYETTCVACHGSDGKGAFAGIPNFTATDGRLAKSDEVLFQSVKFGMQTPGSMMAMPALGGNPDLSDQDVQDVIVFLKSTFINKR